MRELIRVETDSQGRKLVSGRELHEVLKVEKAFSTWIQTQLDNVDAVESQDYCTSFKGNASLTQEEMREMSSQQRSAYGVSIDYILTLDIAKEICMCVGVAPRTNPETKVLSKQVRKYFIECEKQLLQQVTPSYMIADPIERAKRWIAEQEERMALEQQKEQLLIETQSQQQKIEHQKQVILGLTQDSPKPELRQRINQIIRYGARGGYQGRYALAYREFDLTHHMNIDIRLRRAIESGVVKPRTNRMDFICSHLDMTWELYQVVTRIFEGDLRAISESILECTERA